MQKQVRSSNKLRETTESGSDPSELNLREIFVPKNITVKQLAYEMDSDPVDVIKELIRNGVMANINQTIDYSTASLIAEDLGFVVTLENASSTLEEDNLGVLKSEDDPQKQVSRPPIVTIMGHVDHGKTTLLDAIRQSNLTEAEVGGITQRIGAYQVEYGEKRITFLDTPGHEAFTAMRSRGAKITDIAVLVVAADDGVMPQTLEAIDHAKAADVPIIVAINKIDVPDANPDHVKTQLVERGLVIEEWGGEVIAVPVSAITRDGIPELLENILLVAEISELKADPDRLAVGTIVEAQVDKNKGTLATVLVQTGTLRLGQSVVVGNSSGRIKALLGNSGVKLESAGPSTPAEILGLDIVPDAGDTLIAVDSDKVAKDIIKKRQKYKESQISFNTTLEEASSRLTTGELTDINLVIKTDMQGSVDAVRESLNKLTAEDLRVNIIHAGVGTINESDVLLAETSQAIIIGFNTKIEPGARRSATAKKLDIRLYDIIYRLSEDIQSALEGLLTPDVLEITEGHCEVRAVFSVGRNNKIAGSYVTNGRISRNSKARITRQGELLYEGLVSSLKHFKDDVREMNTGFECGIAIEGFSDFEVGDIIESIRVENAS